MRLPSKYRLTLIAAFCCLSLAWNSYSDDFSNPPGDLTVFFKRAISSPPDVEHFIASQRTVGADSPGYVEGARAGSNFFLKMFTSSNALVMAERGFIAGRAGTSEYEFSQNAVSYGIGTNALTIGVWGQSVLVRQFLDMGVGQIEPASVRWDGDSFTAFTAERLGHQHVYGELTISNGLPSRLQISASKGLSRYSVIDYKYPVPPTALGGFPSNMLLSHVTKGRIKPHVDIVLYSIQLATQSLSSNFFAAEQFKGPSIKDKNIFSNDDLYVTTKRGKMEKLPDSFLKSGGFTDQPSRQLSRAHVYILIAIAAIVLATISLWFLKIKSN